MDIFSTTLSPSVAQFSLMGILLVFLGAWMVTFLMLALRSTSQQERARPASRTQVTSNMEAPLEVENAEKVTQIAS